jgi:hypothetical protein
MEAVRVCRNEKADYLLSRDTLEENDFETGAVHLSYSRLTSNMYYYRGYSLLEVWDEDWYCIDIRPNWRAAIVVMDGQAPIGGTYSHFKIYIRDLGIQTVTHNSPIIIANAGNQAIRCYFKLFPDTAIYVSEHMPSMVGGAVVQYTIEIAREEPIS